MHKTMYSRVLWHCTPAFNAQSIMEKGIDPSYSRGAIKRCWIVDKSRILWSIGHISLTYDIAITGLVVFVLSADNDKVVRFASSGVFFSKHVLKVENFTPAEQFFRLEGD